jgi:anti-anti-sigma factor
LVTSSRTPEGSPNLCPVCGSLVEIEPSDPAGGATCPRCGHLRVFTSEDLGEVQFIKPTCAVLDPDYVDRLKHAFSEKQGVQLVLDLSHIQYIRSDTLGKLIGLKKQLAGVKGRLTLAHLHPDLWEVFRITRLDRVFDIER